MSASINSLERGEVARISHRVSQEPAEKRYSRSASNLGEEGASRRKRTRTQQEDVLCQQERRKRVGSAIRGGELGNDELVDSRRGPRLPLARVVISGKPCRRSKYSWKPSKTNQQHADKPENPVIGGIQASCRRKALDLSSRSVSNKSKG